MDILMLLFTGMGREDFKMAIIFFESDELYCIEYSIKDGRILEFTKNIEDEWVLVMDEDERMKVIKGVIACEKRKRRGFSKLINRLVKEGRIELKEEK